MTLSTHAPARREASAGTRRKVGRGNPSYRKSPPRTSQIPRRGTVAIRAATGRGRYLVTGSGVDSNASSPRSAARIRPPRLGVGRTEQALAVGIYILGAITPFGDRLMTNARSTLGVGGG